MSHSLNSFFDFVNFIFPHQQVVSDSKSRLSGFFDPVIFVSGFLGFVS